MGKKGAILGAGIIIALGSLVGGSVYTEVDYARKADELLKSAEWYVGDVNVLSTEEGFVNSLEELSNNPSIETAQMAQRALMLNLFAIYNTAEEIPRPALQSALSDFTEHADSYLEMLARVEGHDEFAAHYRSRVEWRKNLAKVISQYGPASWELLYFLDASVKASESEEHKRRMAELDNIWEERYATPQRIKDKELFIARREIFLDDFQELRNHIYHRILMAKAKAYHHLPPELIPQ